MDQINQEMSWDKALNVEILQLQQVQDQSNISYALCLIYFILGCVMSWQKESESSSWGSWTHCPLWRVDQVTDVWERLIPTFSL